MGTKAQALASQRSRPNCQLVPLPLVPLFPKIATAPTRHDENSFFICEFEEFVAFDLTLEPYRVQVHMLNILEFCSKPFRVSAQHHVGGPSGSTDQDWLAVHAEQSRSLFFQLRGNFANSNLRAL